MRGALGGPFEPFPLFGSDPDMLVQGLFPGICHRFLRTSVLFRAVNGGKILAVLWTGRANSSGRKTR